MTLKYMIFGILLSFGFAACAQAQITAAPWPDESPEFTAGVFARAGVTVADIDESLKFYRDILGLDVIHDRKGLSDPRLEKFSGMTSDESIRLVILRPALKGGEKFHSGYIALSERSDLSLIHI